MKNLKDKKVFARHETQNNDGYSNNNDQEGLTYREWLIAQALTTLQYSRYMDMEYTELEIIDRIAELSIKIADKIIEKLEIETKEKIS